MKYVSVSALSLSLLLVGVAPADSLNVRLVGTCDTPSSASDVAVKGDYAFVVGQSLGLRVISVADPAHPSEVGSLAGSLNAVAVEGSYAYVAGVGSGLRVISVADPAHPTEVGSCEAPRYAFDVVVIGSYAYVADADDSELWVISVSDPAQPTVVGHCSLPDWAIGVDVAGDYAYVADHDSGLHVISASDPTHPVEVGSCASHGRTGCVSVHGDYAFVTNSDSGLQTVSIADPAHPVEVGYFRLPSPPRAVTVANDHAYIGDNASGLRVLSVHDPTNPSEVGYYTAGYALGVATGGGYVYVVCGDSGLGIYQFYGGGVEEGLGPSVPSRKLEATVVRTLPQGAVAFDAMGRRVVNPRSGIYFVREPQAASLKLQAVRKVVLQH